MGEGGILVADGMDFFRQWLRTAARGWGWSVLGEARDASEVIPLYRELRPSLVILDLHLPGGEGFGVLEGLRREDPGARVVVCSADGRREKVIRARRLGALDFLVKPVSEERLRAALERCAAARVPEGTERRA